MRCGCRANSTAYAANLTAHGGLSMTMEDKMQLLDEPATLQSSPIVRRYPGNPILTSADMPYPSRLVYNAGVTTFNDRYVMVFRNDYGYDERLKKAPHFQLGLA